MAIKSIDGVGFEFINKVNDTPLNNNIKIADSFLEGIVTDGLKLWADPRYGLSYSGSGTVWYDIGQANYPDFNLYNVPTWNSTTPRNFELDGTTDDIYTPTGSLFFLTGSGGIAVSMWYKFVTTPTFLDTMVSTGYKNFPNAGTTPNSGSGGTFFLDCRNTTQNAVGGFCWGHFRNATSVLTIVNRTHTTGTWYHLCGTTRFQSNTICTMSLYIDGVLAVSNNRTSAVGFNTYNFFSSSLEIGNLSSFNRRPNMQVGQVLYYTKNLTAAEVLQNYSSSMKHYGK